jgi:transposase
MDQVLEFKQLAAKGVSIRGISRATGASRNTVRRYLRGEAIPGRYDLKGGRPQPVQEQIEPEVRKLLVAEKDKKTPKKQRLTAMRIHRILIKKGHSCSDSLVRRLVKDLRREIGDPLQDSFLPLAYKPGEDAQVDFYEAWVDDVEKGRVKVFVLLVRACYSRRTFHYAAPNQTQEALFEGLILAFFFFGGVFLKLWFDNLTPAVKKVLKRERNGDTHRLCIPGLVGEYIPGRDLRKRRK